MTKISYIRGLDNPAEFDGVNPSNLDLLDYDPETKLEIQSENKAPKSGRNFLPVFLGVVFLYLLTKNQ